MNMLMPVHVGVFGNLVPVAGSSMVTCQGLKFFLALRKKKASSWYRLLQPGGMPSSHAAVVTSLATTLGLLYSWTSPFFQLAVVFGSIVIYDAITLRRAVGEHARRINLISCKEGVSYQDNLLENLGHTPLEVFIGVLIGVLIALIFFY